MLSIYMLSLQLLSMCSEPVKQFRYFLQITFFLALTAFSKVGLTAEQESTSVTVKKFSEIAIYPTNNVPAKVISLNESILSAEITGRITELPFKVGDTVNKQQILAKFQCGDYEFKLQQATAQEKAISEEIQLTRWQLTRTKKLAKMNNVSEELVQKHTATLKKLEANLELQKSAINDARHTINKCTLLAPFAGVITEKFAHIGEYLSPGKQVMKLLDTSTVELESHVTANETTGLQAAMSLNFVTDNKIYPAKIRSVVASRSPTSGMQVVRLQFNDLFPLPGTFGRLEWHSNKPSIPTEYIRQIGNELGFFMIDNNDLAQFIILDDAIEGQPAAITSNISVDAKMIVGGRYAVKDGSHVKIQNNE